MNVTIRFLGVILSVFFCLLSCSDKFEIFSNPTRNAAYTSNNYSEFLKIKISKSNDRNFKSKLIFKINKLDELNSKLETLENQWYLGENLSTIKDDILDMEDDYNEWLIEIKEFVAENKLENQYNEFDSLVSINNSRVVHQYLQSEETKKDNLKEDVMKFLLNLRIPCFDASISDSGCLWISTISGGSETPETIGKLLVDKFSKKYNFRCVTIFDNNQRELGRFVK